MCQTLLPTMSRLRTEDLYNPKDAPREDKNLRLVHFCLRVLVLFWLTG